MKFTLRDGNAVDLPSTPKAATRYVADLFRNQGRNEDEGVEMEWEDMYKYLSPRHTDVVAAPDIRPLLQSSMEVLIREPVEPLMVITGLFNRVQAKGLSTQVLAGAVGAVYAQDIPEHGTYPEVMFQLGGALQTAWIGKSGLAASFTDEALRYSTWDIMAMNLRLMGAALVRHKEQKAVSFLRSLGTELYNNSSPTTSMFGVTTGRGLDMQANGSLTTDDLFKAMAHMAEEGFQPDVLLLNPLFFYQFLQDPVLRNMLLAHGGGSYFERWSGQAGPLDPWSNGSMGAQGPSLGNKLNASGNAAGETATGIAGREHGMTAVGNLPPAYFPWPFRVMVSPLVPFDASSQLGDIYLLSSGNVGFHLVDEDLTQVEWRDENVDVVKVKLRERYGFAVAHEGQGVGVMKNVKLARNYWDGTVTAQTMDVDSEIAADASVL
jgi:hypothetical protein